MIELFVDKQKIRYKSLVFSGGEVHPNIETRYIGDKAQIRASLKSSNEVLELLLVTDALRRNVKVKNTELKIYFRNGLLLVDENFDTIRNRVHQNIK